MKERSLSCDPESRYVLFALADATVAHAFARIAESRGHVGLVASSLEEAIAASPPDVLVTEFGAPSANPYGMDGLALVDTMRALGRDPITILVADPSTSNRELDRAVAAGIDVILERPLLPDELMRAVESNPHRLVHSDECEELQIVVESGPCASEDAAREMTAWCVRCEVIPAARARIATALAEIVENASESGASTVEITASLSPGELEIDVVDNGPGFDAVGMLTAGVLDSTTGLGRAHALADEVQIRSSESEGTHVTLRFRISAVEFDDELRIDLTDLDFFVPATAKELMTTLAEDPDAPVILSPALAVVVGRLLMGPDPSRVLEDALRIQHG